MAAFIAGAQKSYFKTRDKGQLANLNQQDLVAYLEKKNHKLKKEHVARMLDVLYFKIEGIGTIPAKYFFKRYGTTTGLSRDEKLAYTAEFLKGCDKDLSQIEKARELVKFIEKKTGKPIKLSDSPDEHNKYKQFKTIIQQVEGAKE
jgi:hypothetical protein